MKMEISRSLLEQILALAAAEPEREICGLLFGDAHRITAFRPAANVSDAPHRSFEIDPSTLFDALRAERRGGPRVLGHYHSHPSGEAMPSACDAAMAEPRRLWLIVSGREARLWLAANEGPVQGRFRPIALEACDP